jgi:hypothetical protein
MMSIVSTGVEKCNLESQSRGSEEPPYWCRYGPEEADSVAAGSMISSAEPVAPPSSSVAQAHRQAVIDKLLLEYMRATEANLRGDAAKLRFNVNRLEDKTLCVCFRDDKNTRTLKHIFNAGRRRGNCGQPLRHTVVFVEPPKSPIGTKGKWLARTATAAYRGKAEVGCPRSGNFGTNFAS